MKLKGEVSGIETIGNKIRVHVLCPDTAAGFVMGHFTAAIEVPRYRAKVFYIGRPVIIELKPA